jgi:phosphoglycolate phosphatase-like HAD superfamily hydrolase
MKSTLLLLLIPAQAACFTLITFDVDGTLVKGSGKAAAESAHARAFSHAVSTVLNNSQPVTSVADALPINLYHGSTDGLILLRLARATLGLESKDSFHKLEEMFTCMYDFISAMEDTEIASHITPLPGVMDHLNTLATATMRERVMCGLVTGNVEGVARKKMKAVGIFDTHALCPPCATQKQWEGSEEYGFLGGFGSDYCSGDIDSLERNHLDRGEQIAIAANRCKNILANNTMDQLNDTGTRRQQTLKRVVHVGDAPADVLAAKWFSERQSEMNMNSEDKICVGCVAVATGSYTANELRELAGEPIVGVWEPVILEEGMGDPRFLEACGIF